VGTIADAHRFTQVVTPTDGQVEADDWMARYGHLHPRYRKLRLGYSWELRNVSTGQTVASGVADDEETAEDEAAKALEQAQDREAARVLAEHGTLEE